jgi:hypothetical protein
MIISIIKNNLLMDNLFLSMTSYLKMKSNSADNDLNELLLMTNFKF